MQGECKTSITNVDCTINDTGTTKTFLETTVTAHPLVFTAPTDSLKLDGTASTTYSINATGG